MTMVTITRNTTHEPASLLIENISGPWRLMAGNPKPVLPLLQEVGSGTFSLNLPQDKWLYFHLQNHGEDIFFAEKKLPLEGAYNFRDMGGFKNQQGRRVAWGKLFRADDMMDLTQGDLRYLASIPLTSVVDFRTREEISWAPDRKPANLKHHFQYHVVPGGMESLSLEVGASMPADDFMAEIYRHLVLDEGIRGVYSKFFQRLTEPDKLPLLFHCSAGKDRTGWAAAMFLFALGVDEQTIMDDYMLSAAYIKGKYPPGNDRFTVKTMYMRAGLEQARQSYGSVEAYLRQGLNLNLDKLRAMYLY